MVEIGKNITLATVSHYTVLHTPLMHTTTILTPHTLTHLLGTLLALTPSHLTHVSHTILSHPHTPRTSCSHNLTHLLCTHYALINLGSPLPSQPFSQPSPPHNPLPLTTLSPSQPSSLTTLSPSQPSPCHREPFCQGPQARGRRC